MVVDLTTGAEEKRDKNTRKTGSWYTPVRQSRRPGPQANGRGPEGY